MKPITAAALAAFLCSCSGSPVLAEDGPVCITPELAASRALALDGEVLGHRLAPYAADTLQMFIRLGDRAYEVTFLYGCKSDWVALGDYVEPTAA